MSIECSRFLEHPCPFILTRAYTAVDLLTRYSLSETSQLVKVTEHALGRELVGGERAKESQHRQKVQGKTARTSVVNCNFMIHANDEHIPYLSWAEDSSSPTPSLVPYRMIVYYVMYTCIN